MKQRQVVALGVLAAIVAVAGLAPAGGGPGRAAHGVGRPRTCRACGTSAPSPRCSAPNGTETASS